MAKLVNICICFFSDLFCSQTAP